MKKYLDKDVYKAFTERINFIFNEFEHIYVSVSAGKDSSVLVQLTNKIAQKRKRKFDVMFVDYEAQYKATIDHIYELKKLSNINQFYHIALPFKANNASSVFERFWYPWNKEFENKWVRPLPKDAFKEGNHPFGQLYNKNLFLRGIFKMFSVWYKKENKADKVANLIGIRANESMHRFRAVAFGENKYKKINYSTRVDTGLYNFYPIYDWLTEDIWVAVSHFDLMYNQVYELLYKNGISIHQARIAQPFGLRQIQGLSQWSTVEPETWHKLVNRVSGANFGNLYSKTSLLGHNGSCKPRYMTYQQYTVFLLESLGLYDKDLMLHYYRKIRIYFDHYLKEGRILFLNEIPEEISKKEVREKYFRDNGRWIQWKRIARCIEKNDFVLTGCNYGITKQDKIDYKKLKVRWGKLLDVAERTKTMMRLAKTC